MKKLFSLVAILSIVMVANSCKKDSEKELYPSSDYQLSADGKVLEKWLNAETTSVDMQKDIKLRKVTTIGVEAFAHHSNINSVIISDKVTTISNRAFVFSGIREVFIPNSVINLAEKAFSNSNLASVTIPGSIKNIGKEAFGYSSLRNLVIGEGVTNIAESAFNNCRKLESVSLPNSLISIGDSAFFVCPNLPTISIPKNVTYLGSSVFFGCRSLNVINLEPINPPTMGSDHLFQDVTKRINVPASSVDIYKTHPKWSKYADRIMAQP